MMSDYQRDDFLRSVGKSMPRTDAYEKVQGKAKYADDISMPGMLWGRVLRSPYPHAKIIDIKIDKAIALKGVEAVLTAKDIPGKNLIGSSKRKADCPVLCEDKVRYIGDSVALVAAQSEEIANEALDLIEVIYEPLAAVFAPEEALREDAPLIHESGNLLQVQKLVRGDADKALAQADIVISNIYANTFIQHAYLEPDTVISYIDEKKGVNLLAADRWPHNQRELIASILNLSVDNVRVISGVTNGGSFGGKLTGNPIRFQACLLAWKTKRPVKMKFSREDIFKVGCKHTPFIVDYTTGADRLGNLLAVKAKIILDSGAYADASPGVLMLIVISSCGPYRVPNVNVIGELVYTNNPTCGAIRGFGDPQIAVAYETQIDILAEKLGMNSWEIRRRNALRSGDYTATGQKLSASVGLLDTVREVKMFVQNRLDEKKRSENCKRRGRGIACIWKGCGRIGVYNPSESAIEAHSDGIFTIYTSIGDLGQGSHTILKQIAADTLGVPYENIKLVGGDTDLCPDSGTETATRVTYFVGNAVRIAAMKLKRLMHGEAAEILNLSTSMELVFNYDKVISPDSLNKVLISELISSLKERGIPAKCNGFFEPKTTSISKETGEGIPYPIYGFGTIWAEVEVDIKTGKVDVLNIVANYDVGKAIHPLNVEGQIEGGVLMSVGNALSEEIKIENGRVQNCDFTTYLIPTFMDAPRQYPLYVEANDPSGPFGAKGLAEHTTVGPAAAILNAIYDAIGIRFYEIPVTPEKVLLALKRKELDSK